MWMRAPFEEVGSSPFVRFVRSSMLRERVERRRAVPLRAGDEEGRRPKSKTLGVHQKRLTLVLSVTTESMWLATADAAAVVVERRR